MRLLSPAALVLACTSWVHPANACSKLAPRASTPSAADQRQQPYPTNVRVVDWQEGSQVPGLRILDSAGQAVAATRAILSGRTEVIPAAPLAAGMYTIVDSAHREYAFVVGEAADTTPPVLSKVSAPSARSYAKGFCPASLVTTFRVTVEDESPVLFAVWRAAKRPDLTNEPVWYAHAESGVVSVEEDRYPGDPPVGSRHWALMAIDAAGNRSDVVFSPENKRVSGFAFDTKSSESLPSDAQLAPPPPAAPRFVPKAPPAQPPTRGCGCDAPGQGTVSSTPLLVMLAVLAPLVRRTHLGVRADRKESLIRRG